MISDNTREVLGVIGKSAPPTIVSAGTLWGIRYEEWVYIATFVFTVMQIHYLMKAKGTYQWVFSVIKGAFTLTRKVYFFIRKGSSNGERAKE